jgi:hypothetical protein
MTSLAALAHTAPAAAPFNGLFYATVATIIPVLFLAIAVQGRAYDNLLQTLITAANDSRRDKNPGAWKLTASVGAATALVSAAVLILICGAAGELVATLALARQHAGGVEADFAVSAVLFLTAATAAGPAVALSRSWASAARLMTPIVERRQPARAHLSGPPTLTGPAGEPDEPTETGKTDPP